MEKPVYNIETSPDGLYHIFESIGNAKTIKKLAVYIPDENRPEMYHLVFGDLKDDDSIDVFAISNNQDMKIILSSVIRTLPVFFEKNPDKKVFFTGSTDSRTRLYRATIAKLLHEAELYYHIYGLLDDGTLEPFVKSNYYKGYLIEKKS